MGMKVLKLFFILALFSFSIGARESETLVLRGMVPSVVGLGDINSLIAANSSDSNELKKFMSSNSRSEKYQVRKIKDKKNFYIEVTFH